MYNMTNITAANTWYELGYHVNFSTGGFFFTFIMIVLTFSYYAIFKKQSFKVVFLAGNFFSAFVATILFGLKYVPTDFLVLPYLMLFAAVIVYIFNNE